jgi:hypothetical protein
MQCGLFFVKVDEVARRLSVASNILACIRMEMEFPYEYINFFTPCFLTNKGMHIYNGNMGNLFSRKNTREPRVEEEVQFCYFCDDYNDTEENKLIWFNYLNDVGRELNYRYPVCLCCFLRFPHYRRFFDCVEIQSFDDHHFLKEFWRMLRYTRQVDTHFLLEHYIKNKLGHILLPLPFELTNVGMHTVNGNLYRIIGNWYDVYQYCCVPISELDEEILHYWINQQSGIYNSIVFVHAESDDCDDDIYRCVRLRVMRQKNFLETLTLHTENFYRKRFNKDLNNLKVFEGIVNPDIFGIIRDFVGMDFNSWLLSNTGMHSMFGNIPEDICRICSFNWVRQNETDELIWHTQCQGPEYHLSQVHKIVSIVRSLRFKNHVVECVVCLTPGQLLCNRCYVTELSLYDSFRLQSGIMELPLDDWCIKLCEDLALLLMDLISAKTYGHYMKAIVYFAKLRTSTSLLNSEFVKLLKDKFASILGFQEQSFSDYLDSGSDLLKRFDEIKNAPIFQKLYRFAMFAMSVSLFDRIGLSFDSLGYTFVEKAALKKKFHCGVDLFQCFADTLLFLCRKGYQIYVSKSLDPLFHSGTEYEKFYNDTILLKQQSALMDNPELHGIKESNFLGLLDETIEKGESIHKHAIRMNAYEKRKVAEAVSSLKMIKSDIVSKKYAASDRETPFSILVCGESGIGKSTLTNLLFQHYGKKCGLNTDSSSKYVRNAGAKFWDMFRTSCWCLVMDDIASIHPNKTPNGDPTLLELIQIVNSVAFMPDRASLEDKGKTPFRGKLVIGTTNTENLNTYFNFSCPSAAQRRFPYIVIPVPREEYQGYDGRLDSHLVPRDRTSYPDLWTFTVKKIQTTKGHSMAKSEVILEKGNLKDFLIWYNKAIEDHEENQRKMKESLNDMKEIVLCDLCALPSEMCECTQSGGFLDASFFNLLYLMIFGIVSYEFFIRACKVYSLYRAKVICNTIRSKFRKLCGYFYQPSLPDREFWYNLGEKVQTSYNCPNFLIKLASFLTTGCVIYKMFSSFKTIQGAKMPEPRKERENPWYNKEINTVKFDVTAKVACLRGQLNTLVSIISNNVMYIEYVSGRHIEYSRILCLGKQLYVTNNHNVPKDFEFVRITCQPNSTGVNGNSKFTISQDQIWRDDSRDLCLLHLPFLPPRKDITQYFASKDFDVRANGIYLKRMRDGSLETLPFKSATRVTRMLSVFNIFNSVNSWDASPNEPTVVGDCGMPMILDSQLGPIIVGLHVAGNETTCRATGVTREWISENADRFKSLTLQTSTPSLSTPTVTKDLTTLHHKSVFRYMETGTANVYGSFLGFRRQPKTMVEDTIFKDYLLNHGYTTKYTAPMMGGYIPKRIAALDLCRPVQKMDQSILQKCADAYFNDIVNNLPREEWELIHPYDNFTTVNGAAGISYVDAINRGTSAGFPWSKKKHFLNESVPPRGEILDPVMPVDEVMTRVYDIENSYRTDKRAYPVFTAHLKDEPVTFKKREMGKTRVFCGAPYDYVVVVRKYLLSVVRVIQRNRFVFESAPGTIAQSKEWHNIYEYLVEHGQDRIVAGDYKAFDKRMPAQLMLMAYDVVYRMCEKAGYSPEELKMVRGIATDTSFPLVDYFGDLVEFVGSNPSGHPLTVIINGIANSLYMRYCYYVLNPSEECTTFKENVNLMTYGDDNIMGVSKCINWFHHTSIAHALAKIDVTYTMADKEAESVPFINISNASFLKRYWRFDKDLGYFVCPLEHDSIEKSLMTWVRSKTIVSEEQGVAVLSSVVREYFFYGKRIFNQRRNLFMRMVEDLDLSRWVLPSTFPTWDSLAEQWLEVSRGL